MLTLALLLTAACNVRCLTFALCQQTVLSESQRQADEFLPSQPPLLNVCAFAKQSTVSAFLNYLTQGRSMS